MPAASPDALVDGREVDALRADLARRGELGVKSLEELLARARSIRKAVMFVGRTEGGEVRFGTAFVISRRERLLATNAHVADLMTGPGSLRAILDGTGESYVVDRRWYHPGVLRRTRDRAAVVRSQDPGVGEVVLPCPDVAVLRLAPGGPDLPEEVELASVKELDDLAAQAVAVVGFPAYNYTRWPGPGNKVVATVQEGIVNRLSDFKLEADAPPEALQLVQHSVETWFGFSGAPLFLASGHVAAIVAGTRPPIKERDLVVQVPIAIRVDCLGELLAHHGLADRVKIGDGPSRPRHVPRPGAADDPGDDQHREAVRLVEEAEQLARGKEYGEAIARCERAIALAPRYAPAYRWGAQARWHRCSDSRPPLPLEEQARLMREAIDYLRKSLSIGKDLDDLIDLVGMNNYQSALTRDRQGYRDSLDVLEKILDTPNLGRRQRGRALQSRASVRSALDDRGALDDYDEAVRLLPEDPFVYDDRAAYHERAGRDDLAASDRRKARDLRSALPSSPPR
ncbi:MAG: tetratricopeptide repeat-containing serine protease family protein [Solirubrobacterales bacterium]